MKIADTKIKGCYEVFPLDLRDHRGRFVKPFHQDDFRDAGLELDIKEEYYSVSKKNVLRGLHFQLPPKATIKVVTCLRGTIFDAVVDLRVDSPTYLKHFAVELSEKKGNLLYIPEGLAHGFYTLSEEATVLYMCSEVYSQEHDTGLRWNSAGISWPVMDPIVSEKDNSLAELEQFHSPF
ncbi:MAG: dTDP-4-dehydrorhamnose 3,5-epimerase [Bacteroidales bacterium]|nr:dTDP-4-dehydrorhamnose 3,5-epimerase [Bacteroidales bacterium]